MTSKPFSAFFSPASSRLDGLYLAREHYPGRDLENTDHRVQVIPIVIEAPQSEAGQDSSAGVKEDFGIYVELEDSVEDKSRMAFPRIGMLRCRP
jgi:hypothetical protein